MRRVIACAAIAAFLIATPRSSFAAGTLSRSDRLAIDAGCVARDQRARTAVPARFARIFAASETHARWRVADASTLRRIERDPDIYSELATVWRDGASVATVAIAVRSLDYRAQTSYCFRPSGSLARIDETSSGTTNLDRERLYVDEAGAIVARDSKLGLLFPQPNATLSPDVVPAKPDFYPTVRALPFFALIEH